MVGRLPRASAAWLGRRIGDALWLGLPGRRRLALNNLLRAFPASSGPERRRMARRSCQHLGLLFVEICWLLARPLDQVLAGVRLEGREHLDDVMRKHGRALVLTAHLGNWELLPAASRLTPYALTIVVRPLDAPWLNRLAEALRRKAGIELIDKRAALRPVLGALARGRLVGILLDQNASRQEGVFVPFFGRPASTSRAVAVLALRTGAPVVPIFTRREPDGTHRVVVQPPIEVEAAGAPERAVTELTARCTAVIEAAIRETPEQWLWMHERWRTRPAPPP
ncbi:MAG TPA: lysophospholipid acyltransferase family protein [Methylomirabilota bacterium]|nr:lysophospholipid acyltransferase family protein [Methylomirabilota bacterium]